MPSVNDSLQDRAIRHQIYLTRYATGVANRMIALLNRADADMVRRIQALDPTSVAARFQEQRLQKMLERIREINDRLRAQVREGLSDELIGLAQFEAEFTKRVFTEAVPAISFTSVSPQSIRAAALSRPFQSVHLRWATTGEHVDELFRRRLRLVKDEIRLAFVEGDSTERIVRRIRGTRANNYRDGLLEISRRDAQTMARTAVNHTANAARQAFYDENAEVIKGVRWLAILDGRTSAVCRGRDGKVYPIDSGPRPPAHPNCRSSTVPVLKSFREIGVDAPDLTGNVPDYQTYNEWLRTQPRSFVNDVLGPTKAKLYLDGKLSLDRFIDRAGQEYDLDELRRREADAFERAGLAA